MKNLCGTRRASASFKESQMVTIWSRMDRGINPDFMLSRQHGELSNMGTLVYIIHKWMV